jgi:hypothetical protein
MAYNLGNLWRRLVLPRRIGTWSLTSLQQRLVKTGGRLVKNARYYWPLLAEGHLTRRPFGSMLRIVAALPLADGQRIRTDSQRAAREPSSGEVSAARQTGAGKSRIAAPQITQIEHHPKEARATWG